MMKPTKAIASNLWVFGALGVALIGVSSAQAQVAISEDGVTFPNGAEPVWGLKQYKTGDRGPAGGWVFYVTADGFHGLEAAPEDQIRGAPIPTDVFEWGCYRTELAGADGTALGTGTSNTDDILRDCREDSSAADLAEDYISPSDYFDWYLPSKDELNLMYENIGPGAASPNSNVGGFATNFYWSSSEGDDDVAWSQAFYNGNQYSDNKNNTYRVRAVRAF